MDDFEKELKQGFLEEATQLIEEAEPLFLQLESNPTDANLIASIFRIAHNIKGSSRAVGFSQMAEFTHVFESVLLKIKNGELAPDTAIVNILLRGNDHLNIWIQTLKSQIDASIDSSALVSDLEAVIAGHYQGASAPEPEAISEAPTEPSEVNEPVAADWAPAPVSVEPETPVLEVAHLPEPVVAAPVMAEPTVEPKAEAKPAPVEAKPAAAAANQEDESIRVSLGRLESLINNVGELVILQTVLHQQRHLISSPLIQKTIVQLSKITKDIQDTSMGLRMVPLKQTFQKMQRIVRDTSKSLNKQIKFELEGDQTELDKTVVDQLGDPLVHLIRNAVDHGIEDLEGRQAAGKPDAGYVKLSAYHKGGRIMIEIKDDGKGLDPKKLLAKAIEKKVVAPNTQMSDRDAINLIFAPGFSTKTEVTETSGRGVGMDVVKTNIEKKLGGEIEILTELGKGTTFLIGLPLTLAIIDGMVVKSGEERYIIPLAHVFESIQPTSEDVSSRAGLGEVLSLRGEHMPIVRLGLALGRNESAQKAAHDCIAIICRQGDRAFSVLVDDIIGQQQIVIKQLGQELRNLKGFSGGAILGDGKAALIVDLPELAARANQKSGRRTA